MRYFKNLKTKEVWGHDDTDERHDNAIVDKLANADYEEITGHWPPDPNEALQAHMEMLKLEQQVTKRRLIEAVIGQDSGWLVAHQAKIEEVRARILQHK